MLRHSLFAILVLTVALGCSGSKKKTGTLCQTDGECTGGLCLGGQCVALTACSNQSECQAGVCSQGYCWSERCGTGTDSGQVCPDYAECLDGYCVRKSTEADTSTPDTRDSGSETQCNIDADCLGKVGTVGQCEKPSCQSGTCVKVNKPADATCDDGDACTSGDKCDGNGSCSAGTFSCECKTDQDCLKLSDACNQGGCDTVTHTCVKLPINENDPCDDNNACTTGTTCQNGVCGGGTNPCNVQGDPCKGSSVCTENNGQPVCDYSQNDTKSCDDKSSCTVTDACSAGVCVGTGNPCQEPTNDCRKDALCVKVSDTTHTCDYSPNNGNNCSDQNECTGPQDTCDGSTGTCVGAIMPLGSPCSSVAKEPTFCGFYGDCVPLVSKSFTPDNGQTAFTLGPVCLPGGTEPAFAMLHYMTNAQQGYGDANYSFYTLDNGTMTSSKSLATFQYDIPPEMVCSGTFATIHSDCCGEDYMFASYDTGTWADEDPAGTTNRSTLDEALRTILASPTGIRFYQIYAMLQLGGTTWFAGSGNNRANSPNTYNHLVKCDKSGCVAEIIADLPVMDFYYYDHAALHGVVDGTSNLLWTASYGDTTSAWYLSFYNGSKWILDCDGSNPANSCVSNDTAYIYDLNRGFTDIHGVKSNIWLVGSALVTRLNGAFPLSETVSCTPETEALLCANGSTCTANSCTAANTSIGRLLHDDGTGWKQIAAIPSTKLLREDSTVKVDAYDYVFERVRLVQNNSVVMIQGHYRACIDPTDDQTNDCFDATRNVTVKKRSFLVFYYPGSDTWSQMYPIGDGVQMMCCNGGTCPEVTTPAPSHTLPSCGSDNIVTRALVFGMSGIGVRDTGSSTQVYLLENRPRLLPCGSVSDCPNTTDWSCNAGYCENLNYDHTSPMVHSILSSPNP